MSFLKGVLIGGGLGLAVFFAAIWTIITLSVLISLPFTCTRHICYWAWPASLFFLGVPLLMLLLPVVMLAYYLFFRDHLLPPTIEGVAVGFSLVFGALAFLALLELPPIPL